MVNNSSVLKFSRTRILKDCFIIDRTYQNLIIMNKLFTLLFCIAIITQTAHTQVTITDIDPQIGDQFTLEGFETSFDPGSDGANATWDFSGIGTGTSELTYEVVLTDGLNGQENFLLSTKAWLGSVDGFEIIFYMGSENNAMVEYGSYLDNDGTVIEINYSDPQIRYDSPLVYENTGSDDVAGSLIVGEIVLSTFTGDIAYNVDGYGTLILPNATYDNALRVKTIQEEIHEIGVGGGVTQTTFVTGYSYYVEDYPLPVIIIEDTESFVLGDLFDEFSSLTRLMSYNNVLLDIDALEEEQHLSIYPNPSSNFINLDFNYDEIAELRIINIDGKIAKSLSYHSNSKVDISDLKPGYYIAEIVIDGSYYNRSTFIIAR